MHSNTGVVNHPYTVDVNRPVAAAIVMILCTGRFSNKLHNNHDKYRCLIEGIYNVMYMHAH